MKLYSNITYIFIIWLSAIFLTAALGFSLIPNSGRFSHDFWLSLKNWDGGHYLGIAEVGYSQKIQYAFFPLYPILIRILNQAIGNYLLSAILINIASAFFGVHILYKLTAEYFDKKIAEKTVLAFLFFPMSFFLMAVYSEGLFFFLTIAAFFFLKKNKLFWATILATLASATRLVGLAVVAGILIEILTRNGLSRKNWFVLLAPVGFIFYCIFLYRQTGDPFYFVTAENYWQRVIVFPVVGFWETLKAMPNGLLDLAFAIFGLGFAIRSFRFLPISWSIYSLISVGIPLFTPTLSSIPRFLLPIFPIFILMALIKKQYISLFLQSISIMLLALFSVLFISGYWVS